MDGIVESPGGEMAGWPSLANGFRALYGQGTLFENVESRSLRL
jgi:hypothetical protein